MAHDYSGLEQAKHDADELVAELKRIDAFPAGEIRYGDGGFHYPKVDAVWYGSSGDFDRDALVRSLAEHFDTTFEAVIHQGTAWRSATTEFGRSEVEFTIYSK